MSILYQCENISCNYPGMTRFEMVFQSEAILDSNNLAATFCPFCKKEMVSAADNEINIDTPTVQLNK